MARCGLVSFAFRQCGPNRWRVLLLQQWLLVPGVGLQSFVSVLCLRWTDLCRSTCCTTGPGDCGHPSLATANGLLQWGSGWIARALDAGSAHRLSDGQWAHGDSGNRRADAR